MDEVEIDRGPAGTIVRMRRAIDAPAEGGRLMRDRIAGFEFEQRDDVLIAAVEGEIDSSNAAELRLALSERLPSASSALVLDLSDASPTSTAPGSTCCSTSAAGSPRAARRCGWWCPTRRPMRRVLELCAVDAVAPMDRELDASLRALSET